MRRRRMRRYRPGKENSMMKLGLLFGIILGAVVCGYLTARFALGPLFGYDTEVLKLDFPSKLTACIEAAADRKSADESKENDKEKSAKGYVLQFGRFDAKSGAKTMVSQLEKDGIDAEIQEEDGSYKVISETIDTKEEALKQLEALKDEKNIDVFIDTVD
ncbi:MAG: SPOR domain-containing protein [Firmicutes bacterium]|nr:SPOR domain-containing protein [Bacillota bacterium]